MSQKKNNSSLNINDLKVIWRVFTGNWYIPILLVSIFYVIGYFYVYKLTNIYQASVELLKSNDTYYKENLITDNSFYGGTQSFIDNSNEMRIIKSFDLMKETVVILTSDHGIPHGLKNKPILNNEWVNIPLKIYHPLFNPSEVNSPASTANIYDLIKAIIEDNYKDIGVIRPFNLNSKIDFSISESFFNKKYKALIKDSRYEFRIVTTFDPIKKFIFLNNIIYSEITENNNIINDKDVYNYFFRILVDNINKSKIIKIIN